MFNGNMLDREIEYVITEKDFFLNILFVTEIVTEIRENTTPN